MPATSTALATTPGNAMSLISSTIASTRTSTAATAPTTPASTTPAKPSPGTFRHPRMTEIIQRRNKTIFSERNIRAALVNAAALAFTIVFSSYIRSMLIPAVSSVNSRQSLSTAIVTYALWSLRIILLLNIVSSLRPILPFSKPDNLVDIPLTPSQRVLMGLPPSTSSTPAGSSSPSAGYITPPRYHRRLSSSRSTSSDPVPTTDRRSVSANYSSSPLSTSRYTLGFSPSPDGPQTERRPARPPSNSPFSPSGSPLFHKAIDRQRRQSQDLISDLGRSSLGNSNFGRSSLGVGAPGGLGRSHSVNERGTRSETGEPLTGTSLPTAKRGVNYKWLYDKGFGVSGNGGEARARLAKSESMNL